MKVASTVCSLVCSLFTPIRNDALRRFRNLMVPRTTSSKFLLHDAGIETDLLRSKGRYNEGFASITTLFEVCKVMDEVIEGVVQISSKIPILP